MGSEIRAVLHWVIFLLHVVVTGVTWWYLACGVDVWGTKSLHSYMRHLGGGCWKAAPSWVSLTPHVEISGPLHMASPAKQLDFSRGSLGLWDQRFQGWAQNLAMLLVAYSIGHSSHRGGDTDPLYFVQRVANNLWLSSVWDESIWMPYA